MSGVHVVRGSPLESALPLPAADLPWLQPFIVLRAEDSAVAEISGFVLPELFPAFGLAASL